MGGLALLAQNLPTIYPEAVRVSNQEKSVSDQSDSEWIKLEGIFLLILYTYFGACNILSFSNFVIQQLLDFHLRTGFWTLKKSLFSLFFKYKVTNG